MKYTPEQREICAAKIGAGAKLAQVALDEGIPKSALARWLDEDAEFVAMVTRYKQEVIDSIVGEVASIMPDAVLALKRNLTCGIAHAEVRAALGILSAFLRVRDSAEVSDRVRKLEELLKGEEEVL